LPDCENIDNEEHMDRLPVTLSSFGFKYGLPTTATLVWDVRFLPNPFWLEEMRSLNGLDRGVADYALQGPVGTEFLRLVRPLLVFLVEQNLAAGRQEFWLAIGCTGGQHRSVAVVETLRQDLLSLPVELTVVHRDIARSGGLQEPGATDGRRP
jgi:RNase adapter protein RapZ